MNSLDRLQQTIERLTRLMESEQSNRGGASAPPEEPSSVAFPRASSVSRPENEQTYQRTAAHYAKRARGEDKELDDKWGETTSLLDQGASLDVPLIGPIMAKTARVMKMIRFFGELHDHFSRLNWSGKQNAVDASNESEGLKLLRDEKPIKLADKPPPADASAIPFKEEGEAPPLPLADADPDKFFVTPPVADATGGGKKTHLAPHRLPNGERKTELAQTGGPPHEIPEAPPDTGAPSVAPDAPYSIEAPPPLPRKTKAAHHTQLDDYGLADPDLHAGGPDPLDSLPKAGRSRTNLTEHAPLPEDYDQLGARPSPAPSGGGGAPNIPPALGEASAGVSSIAGGTERAESRVEELLEETNKKLDNIVSVSEKAIEANKSVLGEGQGKPPLGPQSVPQAQPRIKEKTAMDQAEVLAAATKVAEVGAV